MNVVEEKERLDQLAKEHPNDKRLDEAVKSLQRSLQSQVITRKLLEKHFGYLETAKAAYNRVKASSGDKVKASSWDKLVEEVKDLPLPELPDGQVIKIGLLQKRFGYLNTALDVYGLCHRENRSWKALLEKVKDLPLPAPPKSLNELNERCKNLEDTVTVLIDALVYSVDQLGLVKESEKIVDTITSYEEFKEVVFEAYHRLDNEYNYDKYVPIYAIRRDIGERVTRSQFSEWMFQISLEELLSFYVCEDFPTTEDQLRDSIQDSSVRTLYFFCKKIVQID